MFSREHEKAFSRKKEPLSATGAKQRRRGSYIIDSRPLQTLLTLIRPIRPIRPLDVKNRIHSVLLFYIRVRALCEIKLGTIFTTRGAFWREIPFFR